MQAEEYKQINGPLLEGFLFEVSYDAAGSKVSDVIW